MCPLGQTPASLSHSWHLKRGWTTVFGGSCGQAQQNLASPDGRERPRWVVPPTSEVLPLPLPGLSPVLLRNQPGTHLPFSLPPSPALSPSLPSLPSPALASTPPPLLSGLLTSPPPPVLPPSYFLAITSQRHPDVSPQITSRDLGFRSEILYFCTSGWAPGWRRKTCSLPCHSACTCGAGTPPCPRPGAHWDLTRPELGPRTPRQTHKLWRCPPVSPRPFFSPLAWAPLLHGRCTPS